MVKKYIIFAPSYNENVGGSIALHKLCDLINRGGNEAYLYPYFESALIYDGNLIRPFLMVIKSLVRKLIKKQKKNPIKTSNVELCPIIKLDHIHKIKPYYKNEDLKEKLRIFNEETLHLYPEYIDIKNINSDKYLEDYLKAHFN